MTETLKKPQTSIPDLEAALRKSQQQERALAVEVGELPSKIQQAHREDAQRKAQAAREGGTGAEVAADEAAQRLAKVRFEVHASERGADHHGSQSRLAEKRLDELQNTYPGA